MEEQVDRVAELSWNLIEELAQTTNEEIRRNKIASHIDSVASSQLHPVPDFKSGLDWFNVSKALSLRDDLRGKLVLLDFFTYCCINCLHVLPHVKEIEQRFTPAHGLVVIGVHSAKFENEKGSDNVESAVRRNQICHPVVNDVSLELWNSLGIACWPTLYLLGVDGEPLFVVAGEGHCQLVGHMVEEALRFYADQGKLNTGPFPFITPHAEVGGVSGPVLSFPGKVVVHPGGQLIAIADTGHHRVLIAQPDGTIVDEIGGESEGFVDGDFKTARLSSPQGMTFRGERELLVADTNNHAIRQICFETRKVSTLVGTGRQGQDYKGGEVEGRLQEISSPWDLALDGETLYIAMAGTHQVWAYFFQDTTLWNKKYKAGRCCGVVGSGREENRNSRYPGSCGLAQPSGVCCGEGSLYLADSESSTVRAVCLASGAVTGLAGGNLDPTDLFGFGDVDGVGRESKLQHPLGVAWSPLHKDTVYLADSYNDKIKSINTKSKLCAKLPGLEHLKLNEPGGIFAFGENLYIADTNSHSIKLVHLPSVSVSTLKLKYGVKEKGLMKTGEECGECEVEVREGEGGLELSVELELPQGTKPSPRAPSLWTVTLPGGEVLKKKGEFKLSESWELETGGEGGVVAVNCRIYICTLTACVCKDLHWTVRMSPSQSAPAPASARFRYAVTL